MAKKRHTFSKDYKAKVALEALWEGSTIQEIAVNHGVHLNQISQRKAQTIARMSDIFELPNKKSKETRRMGAVFTRNGSKVKAAEKFSKLEKDCKEKLAPNKLVLSLAVNNLNYEELANAYLFYSEGLVVLMNDNNNWLEYSASKMEHDNTIKEMFLKFMKNTGSDILDIKSKSEHRLMTAAELSPDMPQTLKVMILNQPLLSTSVKTVYKGFPLELNEESLGTQKLIKLMCPIMDIFQKGKTFVCNEIESHLYPLIVRQLVSRFIKGKISNAQIICATHNVEMLDLNLFRRDQIYFTAPPTITAPYQSLFQVMLAEKTKACKRNIWRPNIARLRVTYGRNRNVAYRERHSK